MYEQVVELQPTGVIDISACNSGQGGNKVDGTLCYWGSFVGMFQVVPRGVS